MRIRSSEARIVRFSWLAATLAAIVSCSNPESSAPVQSTAGGAAFPAGPTVRVSAKSGHTVEYRDALRFDRGSRGFSLDAGSFVRIGLLDTANSAVVIEVSGSEGSLASYVSRGDGTWQDWRISTADFSTTTSTLTVSFSAPAEFWVSTLESVPLESTQPSVFVVLLDTLRQDHLGCYGYERPVSPNLDVFAKDSIRFSELVPASSWTRPSVASLLTSTYPGVHGAVDRGDRVRGSLPWIADAFEAEGYETEGIMTNPNCVPVWGFGDEFDRFMDMGTEQWFSLDDKDAMLRARKSILNAAGRPQFVYLHALAPHEPFTPPEPFRTQFDSASAKPEGEERERQRQIDLYDAEIAYFDSLFGEFVADLKAAGVYDSSIIVFVSDHGEEFWEHGGTSHGRTLYEEQLRVPLLVKLPGNRLAGTVQNALVEMVDIAPTLLELAGVPPHPAFQGASFMPLFEGEAWTKSIGYASLRLDDKSMEASKTASLKYIQDLVADSERWFDLASDPRELTPLESLPAEADAVKAYARGVGAMGASGVHILITHDSTRPLRVEGEVAAARAASAQIGYPETLSEVRTSADGVQFTLNMPVAEQPKRPSARWRRAVEVSDTFHMIVDGYDSGIATEQDFAEVVVPAELSDEVRVTLKFDGVDVSPDQVHLGREGRHAPLDGTPLAVSDLIAAPFAYDPAALPVGSAVYVWYVAPAESIDDESLDPSLRESLRALGYLGNQEHD